jgi:hypothetical protein
MFPPVEDAVLQNNPEFANLYQILTTAILNPDGTTKNDPGAKSREAVREVRPSVLQLLTPFPADQLPNRPTQELEKHRLKAVKQHLLIQAIAETSPPEPKPSSSKSSRLRRGEPSTALPDPILELLVLLPPLLTSPPDPETLSLILSSEPFLSLPTHLPQLAQLVSSTLHASALDLARIANPNTNPSYLHRAIPGLPDTYTALEEKVEARKDELVKVRLKATSSLVGVLQQHTQILTLLIRTLEAKHGVVARSLELRAEEVSLMARRGELEAKIAADGVRAEVYSPDVVKAMSNYSAHLKKMGMRAEEEIRELQGKLEDYGVGVPGEEVKERTMKKIAQVYGETSKEMEEVQADLDRLGQR